MESRGFTYERRNFFSSMKKVFMLVLLRLTLNVHPEYLIEEQSELLIASNEFRSCSYHPFDKKPVFRRLNALEVMSRIQLNSFPVATKIFTSIWQLPESHFQTTLLERSGRQIGLKGTRRGLKCFVPKRRQKGGSMNNYPRRSPLTDVFLVPVSSRINTACSLSLPLPSLAPRRPVPFFWTRQTGWETNKTMIRGAATILAKVQDDWSLFPYKGLSFFALYLITNAGRLKYFCKIFKVQLASAFLPSVKSRRNTARDSSSLDKDTPGNKTSPRFSVF